MTATILNCGVAKTMIKLRWYNVDSPSARYAPPSWLRSASVDEQGNVYIPAALAGDETIVLLHATWSGNIPIIMNQFLDDSEPHVYLPTWWIIAVYPNIANAIREIERKVKLDWLLEHAESQEIDV